MFHEIVLLVCLSVSTNVVFGGKYSKPVAEEGGEEPINFEDEGFEDAEEATKDETFFDAKGTDDEKPLVEGSTKDVKPLDQFVEDMGYPIEAHEIVTADGYILTYHRVPHGKSGPTRSPGHPVLLVHGILQSSSVWLVMDGGLAYHLADAGYDVWMANARGNNYSRRHKNYNPDKGNKGYQEFWDFSFHEMGAKDIPAGIDYILEKTGRPTLTYLGFSMGTTMFWVMAATCGDPCVSKVDRIIAMAPIARPTNMKIILNKVFYTVLRFYLRIAKRRLSYEFRAHTKTESNLMKMFFSNAEHTLIRKHVIAGLHGHKPDDLHYENSLLSTQYMPAGTSIKTVEHFIQVGKLKSFQQFDYGKENKSRYPNIKTSLPPKYNLKNVNWCPVFFIASDKDEFADKKDVDWLYNEFPDEHKPTYLFEDDVKNFNHMYYFYYKDVESVLYEKLIEFLKKGENQITI